MSAWVQMAEGVQRRVLVDGEQMMQVVVEFVSGAVGAMHNHPHEQITYIVSGRVNFTIEDATVELRAGDSILIPGGKMHGTVALEPSVLLDTFSPPRQEFRV